jgi:hypothetical protein
MPIRSYRRDRLSLVFIVHDEDSLRAGSVSVTHPDAVGVSSISHDRRSQRHDPCDLVVAASVTGSR